MLHLCLMIISFRCIESACSQVPLMPSCFAIIRHLVDFLLKTKTLDVVRLPLSPHYLQFYCLVGEAFISDSVTAHAAAVSFSSHQHCNTWTHPALDREACHPRTVIIPELTSPLSIELLRRWKGHKILCSDRMHCSHPSGLGVKKSKMDAGIQKQIVCRCCTAESLLSCSLLRSH